MKLFNFFILFISITLAHPVDAMTEKNMLRIVPESSKTQLHVNFIRGDISVIGYDGSTINVSNNNTNEKDPLNMDWSNIINVRNNNTLTELSGKKDNLSYSLTIYVPFNTKLTLKVVDSKKISIAGLTNNVEVQAGQAILDLKNIKGPVLATVGQGHIHSWISNFSKENIQSLTLGDGDININMNKSADLSVEIISHHGSFKSEFNILPFPSTKKNNKDKEYKSIGKGGVIKNGAAKLMLNVFNGDISLNKINE
jgi:hypothetical protein